MQLRRGVEVELRCGACPCTRCDRRGGDQWVRSIEHGNLLNERAAAVMAEHSAYLVPTLITYDAMARRGDALGMPVVSQVKNTAVLEAGFASLQLAQRAGVPTWFRHRPYGCPRRRTTTVCACNPRGWEFWRPSGRPRHATLTCSAAPISVDCTLAVQVTLSCSGATPSTVLRCSGRRRGGRWSCGATGRRRGLSAVSVPARALTAFNPGRFGPVDLAKRPVQRPLAGLGLVEPGAVGDEIETA